MNDSNLIREAASNGTGAEVPVRGGPLMIALGVAMIAGWLNRVPLWLIDAFPAFRAIG